MSIATDLINRILTDSKWMQSRGPDDQSPLPAEFFEGALDLELFRDREPDSYIETNHPQPASRALLGSYRHMHSPGVITLYRQNIEMYWLSLLSHAYRQFPYITRKDADRVLRVLVQSVYEHEKFHYVCDFCRRLFHSTSDRWHEEALAVAREWQLLEAQKNDGRCIFNFIHPALSNVVVKEMFDHRSRGYRDWPNFANQSTFILAVSDYVHPGAAQLFIDTKFDFGTWVLNHIGTDSNIAWTEQII